MRGDRGLGGAIALVPVAAPSWIALAAALTVAVAAALVVAGAGVGVAAAPGSAGNQAAGKQAAGNQAAGNQAVLDASSSLTCPAGLGTGAPGVSSSQIKIAAISTLSGILAADFGSLVPGVKAYLDTVDAHGGVDGRKIVLAYNLDDAGVSSQFQAATHTAIDQDQAFAVAVSSLWFTPSYFVATCTPTYGYNVTGNWAGPPNLFATGGSTQTFGTVAPSVAYLADHIGAKRIAMLAVNFSTSSDLCKTVGTLLRNAGYDVAFTDLALTPIEPNLTPDVQRMQQAGVDFIVSCMPVTANVALSRDLQQYGLHAPALWFNGADGTVVKKYSNLLQGVYFHVENVPETAATVDPGVYPGLQAYLKAMNRYSPGYADNALALSGWESAALLVDGIKAAGKHPTQAAVVAATNKMTEFNAGGLEEPIDWATGHTTVTQVTCSAFEQVKGATVVPALGKGKQVFLCFTVSKVKHPVPVAPPEGLPGPGG